MHMSSNAQTFRKSPSGLVVALAIVLAVLYSAHGVRAQQPRPPAGPPAPPAGIETIQVKPNFWVIFGGGANVAVQTGEEGIIVVDSGSAENADKVLAAIKAISSQPIRYIINTTADPDHVGGNATLAAAGISLNPNAFNAGNENAAILAYENVLMRMSAPTGSASPFPVETWPTETFTGKFKSMYLNGDGIQVIRQPAAHSDGDSIVFFRRADIIVTGDVLDLRHFPVIDMAKGGTIQGEIDALNRLLELAIPAMPLVYKEPRTYLVPGHGRISDHAEVVEYRDMVTVVRDVIQTMVDKGMTLEQVKAANPTQGYRKRYGTDTGPWTTDMFVEAVFKGLTPARKS
jgi:glyoxylase-like metal-dependent hydrolase (beta-lactamase superfamily II)